MRAVKSLPVSFKNKCILMSELILSQFILQVAEWNNSLQVPAICQGSSERWRTSYRQGFQSFQPEADSLKNKVLALPLLLILARVHKQEGKKSINSSTVAFSNSQCSARSFVLVESASKALYSGLAVSNKESHRLTL